MSQEPWELPEEEIWGTVDATALLEAFRRSEISEARGRWYGANPEERAARLVFLQFVGNGPTVNQWAEALAKAAHQAAHAFQQFTQAMSALTLTGLTRPAARPPRASYVPTLKHALLERQRVRARALPSPRHYRRQHR